MAQGISPSRPWRATKGNRHFKSHTEQEFGESVNWYGLIVSDQPFGAFVAGSSKEQGRPSCVACAGDTGKSLVSKSRMTSGAGLFKLLPLTTSIYFYLY